MPHPGSLGLDTFQLSLGAVGPWSLAEDAQKMIHRARNRPTPMGWDNQLGNEITLQTVFDRRWRNPILDRYGLEDRADVILNYGFAAGTVYVLADFGALVRVGNNLPVDFGPPRMRPSFSGADPFQQEHRAGWYGFGGANVRIVARDLFLDGSTFGDSHRVAKRWTVAEAQFGLVAAFEKVRVSYAYILRTREFIGQREPDQFAGIAFTYRNDP